MSLNTPSPKGQNLGRPIFKYIGPEKQYQNLWFERIAEFDVGKDGKFTNKPWPDSSDSWKYGFDSDTVFMMTIDRNDLQPPPLQKMFCSVIETPEDVAVGDSGIGGIISSGSQKQFKEHFQSKGVQ